MKIDSERTEKHHAVQSKLKPKVELVLEKFQKQLAEGNAEVLWTKHEKQRELFRSFSRRSVLEAIQNGWVIEAYNNNDRSMSVLIIYFLKTTSGNYRPMHVYVNISKNVCNVITVYDPRSGEHMWSDNYQKRVLYAKGVE
ncbi:DUF4258 domain-containing protein [Cytobacillus sp. IB215665]|uniref:DUF4258 domain-containing protein n=1 Tax=Cytobacillus sp. IB215665 TaxID=3097357 RepID=UPI002A116D1C|nr:DUF4258 domain-containing protein [Cytobacillus sp. IB215665]MDX8367684.1 DUF4258 domain-containing protein [Cytobacillus sp. IB215665]